MRPSSIPMSKSIQEQSCERVQKTREISHRRKYTLRVSTAHADGGLIKDVFLFLGLLFLFFVAPSAEQEDENAEDKC